MTERDTILAQLPEGLQGQCKQKVPADFLPVEGDLWAFFFRQLELLGGHPVTDEQLRQLLKKSRWVDADAETYLKERSSVTSIWEAEVGFSKAVCAVAQSGTLMLTAGPGGSRLSSLAPAINVVLVDENSIVPTLNEAFGFMRQRSTVFITGPSRTADIEGILVRGVHGPGELLVYVVPA